MKLIGSVTSPYVRFVRVTLHELGVLHEFHKTGPFGVTSDEDHALINSANPLMKVPVLLSEGETIIDSRIIITHLIGRFSGPGDFGHGFPKDLASDNTLTTIYGVLEAAILKFIMINAHPEIDAEGPYLARSMERIGHALSWLDDQPALGPGFGPAEAMLLCGLEWMRKRQVYEWSGFHRLVELHSMHFERASMLETRIPETI